MATVLTTYPLKELLRIERDKILASAVSANERFLAISDGRACVLEYEILTGRPVTCLHAGWSSQHPVQRRRRPICQPDQRDRRSRSVENRGGEAVVDEGLESGPQLTVPAFVPGVAFSRDDRHLLVAMGPFGQTICYWSFESGNECPAVSQPGETAQGIVSDPDFLDVAFTGTGGAARRQRDRRGLGGSEVRDRNSLHGLRRVAGVQSVRHRVRDAAGRWVATLWARGQVVGHLVHPDAVRAWFSPDGQTIVTTCEDGLVRIWDAGLRPDQQNDFGTASNRLVGVINHGPPAAPTLPNRAEP